LKNIHLTVDHASAMNCDWMTHPTWTLVSSAAASTGRAAS
jgi:hypothetical protein